MRSPQPDRRATAEHIWAQARAFVEANERKDDLRARLGLGIGHGRVKAMLLLKDGPLSLMAIAAAHNVTASYATIIVDQLEKLGYVERSLDAADKRRKLVALTAAGYEAVALAEEAIAAAPPALDVLTDDELRQLKGLLARLCP